MSTKPTADKPATGKPLMSNHAKLIIIVLGFFLALTYVRGFTLEANSPEVIFSGYLPGTFALSVTNTSNTSLKPSFIADGPFIIILPADFPTVPAHDSKTYNLKLVPSSSFKVGDVYSGQIRVVSIAGEKSLPLTFRMKNAPFVSFSGPNVTGLFSFASFSSLPSISNINWVDGLLIVVVVILAIALVARVKNRVIGG